MNTADAQTLPTPALLPVALLTPTSMQKMMQCPIEDSDSDPASKSLCITGNGPNSDADEIFATIWKRSSVTCVREIAFTDDAQCMSTVFHPTRAPMDVVGAKYQPICNKSRGDWCKPSSHSAQNEVRR
jgi:hypothetical protein